MTATHAQTEDCRRFLQMSRIQPFLIEDAAPKERTGGETDPVFWVNKRDLPDALSAGMIRAVLERRSGSRKSAGKSA